MPQGYKWDVRVRIDPVNGDDVSLNLMTLLTDVLGPAFVQLAYVPDIVQRETVNQNQDHFIRGFRPTVTLLFDVTQMNDQATLAQILNALAAPDCDVFLSLDGGTTERRVTLTKNIGPVALGGYTHTGARYSISVEAVDLIQTLPDIGSGTW